MTADTPFAGEKVYWGHGPSDFWLVKTDASGNAQWNRTYPGAGDEWAFEGAYCVAQTSDGGYALTGTIQSLGGIRADFLLIKLATPIPATVDFRPETLNLRSAGQWVTTYIELPEGYNVADIIASSIHLNNTVPVDLSASSQIGDYDSDGISDLMVKFSTASVASYISQQVIFSDKFAIAALDMIGKLNDGTFIRGSDTIKVTMHAGQG